MNSREAKIIEVRKGILKIVRPDQRMYILYIIRNSSPEMKDKLSQHADGVRVLIRDLSDGCLEAIEFYLKDINIV